MKNSIIFVVLASLCMMAHAEIDTSTCEQSLSNIREPNLSCKMVVRLNEKEKDEMHKATSNAISNLSCEATINANKADMVRSLSEPTVNLPKIIFICAITFNGGLTKNAVFDVSPAFKFKDNRVVDATLNMSEVTGIGFLGAIVRHQLSSNEFNNQLKDEANQALAKLVQGK